jgi:hypothetical protein
VAFEAPWPPCEAKGGPHKHLICTRCGAERVVLPDAGELAWLASVN